jgi:hypothetical protein
MPKKRGKVLITKRVKYYSYRKKNGKIVRVPAHPGKFYISQFKLNQMRNRIIREQQIKENDWAHLSANYPNLIGFTDEEVDKFIEYYLSTSGVGMDEKEEKEKEREELKEYISKIRCYNDDDFRELSIKMQEDFNKKSLDQYEYDYNKYIKYNTVYVTSPRGGFEVLSAYAYANNLSKQNFPVDFYGKEVGLDSSNVKSGSMGNICMASKSMPYGSTIDDISDIVFIDDICMSGEQQNRAYEELDDMIKKFKITPKERPRLHYMAIIGSKDQIVIDEKTGRRRVKPVNRKTWDSVTFGEERDFSYNNTTKEYNDISATMFPYGVPDGDRHFRAWKLYHHYKNK